MSGYSEGPRHQPGTIPVYIRDIENDTGRLLGNFFPNQLHDVEALFAEYDVWDGTMGGLEGRREADGQFVVDDNVYFEIVLSPIKAN